MQHLQPLNTPPLGSGMPSSIKPSYRTVFAGSRHTRALSLLSPRDPGSHSDLLLRAMGPSKPHQAAANDVAVPATVHDLSPLDVESGSEILETGKQLVGDFRQGLWTFFKDFKQLTVGDEGVATAGLRKRPVIAPGNMPRRQNMKEKRPALDESPFRTAGALDVEREPSRKRQIEFSDSKQGVGSSLDRPTEAVVPTSILTDDRPEGGDSSNFSDSDGDGWDNSDTPEKPDTPKKGPC